jgi:hypothetical protein
MKNTIINTYTDTYKDSLHKTEMAPQFVCSLAAYLDEHREPIKSTRGAYTRLHSLAQPLDVSVWLADEISREVGTKVTVALVRDGEAAAIAYAGLRPPKRTAVVMLGTALGVGFVPEAKEYRPLSRDFVLSQEGE